MLCLGLSLLIIASVPFLCRIRRVEFIGDEFVSGASLLQAKRALLNQCIFTIPRSALKPLLCEPRVKSVKLVRKLPYTLIVQVQERAPCMLLRTDVALFVVARDGLLYQRVKTPAVERVTALPIFVADSLRKLKLGDRVPQRYIRQVMQVMRATQRAQLPNIRVVEWDAVTGIKLYLDDGTFINVGSSVGLERRLAFAAAARERLLEKGERAIAIDARTLQGSTWKRR
ncbi:MAG TPA: FtsQ-type POTRA domain-containing protein [Armatimonadetes bacterium]|nr:FtsQ-type POTRA domain-containing protein [Armatimonadota bacterium]